MPKAKDPKQIKNEIRALSKGMREDKKLVTEFLQGKADDIKIARVALNSFEKARVKVAKLTAQLEEVTNGS